MQPDEKSRDKCHPENTSSASRGAGERTRNWKLTLAYDGSDFAGWQVQPGLRTVQGELAAALERITGKKALPQGSGRTDAGVHALGQVSSFALDAPIPAENLLRALRFSLPPDIQPLAVERVADDFHARHSAVAKTYEYRVLRGGSCSPFLSRYVCLSSYALDVAAMQRAARMVVGEHDFSSFAATDPDIATRLAGSDGPVRSTVRRIFASHWQEGPDGLLTYTVSGSGFLHHMVRNLAGTFLEVGRGLRTCASIAQTLVARDRGAAGATAPAHGLFLVSVDYPASDDPTYAAHMWGTRVGGTSETRELEESAV